MLNKVEEIMVQASDGANLETDDVFVLPASFAQRRLWFLDQLEPEGAITYNEHTAVRISGLLDIAVLARSLNEVVRRHESLRTSFTVIDEELCQVIQPTLHLPMLFVDLSSLSDDGRESELKRHVVESATEPFDLSQAPLLRAKLIRLRPTEHVLHIVIHHIIYDRWSQSLLRREIFTLYEAFSAGSPSPLPELPIQYADYAVWQHQWFQGEQLQQQLTYWKKQLGGKLPTLGLPTDRPRPPVQTFNGDYMKFTLSETLSQALRDLSAQENVTMYMILIAAFKTLLHRYSGQEDILIGSAIANRTRVELEQLVGFFVNTLVLRTDFSGDPSFQTLLKRVSQTAFESYAHQDLPFEKLVEELHPERDLSRHPIFQVLFVLKNLPDRDLHNPPGLHVERFEVEHRTAKFELSLYIDEDGQQIKGFFEYNTDLFERSTIKRMIGHFQTLLEGIAANPDRPLSTLPLLTVAERRQLLFDWNDTQTDYPKTQCLHQLFEAQVERTPDDIAVIFEADHLTYRELDRKANQVARHLKALGVGPETSVGIYMDRSLEMIVGLLGVLKAGGAYLPLDPTYPQDRIAFMVEDAQSPVLLTQARLVKNLPEHQAQVVCIDADWETISTQSEEKIANSANPDNLCYLIYTSGSTGKPKGVMVLQRNVVNFFAGMDAVIPHDPAGVWLAVTSLSFDISVLELFWTLTRGFKIVLYADIVRHDYDSENGNGRDSRESYTIPALIKRHQVTHFQCTPSMASMLLIDEETRAAFHQVQTFMVGGEALSVTLAAQLQQIVSGQVINMYGPTETTIWSSTYVVNGDQTSIPIGWPIANTQLHVLDKNLQPVPVGVTGELFIGGDGVVRGYLNRPNLTAERFIKHPFSDKPGDRLYRTGDLARYRSDGNIEFFGRIDHQVKIRGHRIELGEIETLLEQHPAIHEAVVIAREDTPGDVRLVAYMIPSQGHQPVSSELRSYIKQKLPEFMVPAHFVSLSAFPKTPNQKIDRKALPAPTQVESEAQTTYEPPKNELEQTVVTVWQELLKVPRVGLNDNFFDLGGHSLLIVQAHQRLRQMLDRDLRITDMFRFPTIRTLTEYLSQDSVNGDNTAAQKISDRAQTRRETMQRQRQQRQRVR